VPTIQGGIKHVFSQVGDFHVLQAVVIVSKLMCIGVAMLWEELTIRGVIIIRTRAICHVTVILLVALKVATGRQKPNLGFSQQLLFFLRFWTLNYHYLYIKSNTHVHWAPLLAIMTLNTAIVHILRHGEALHK
jgi:hypothetical protein